MFVVWVTLQLVALWLISSDIRFTAQGTPGARQVALQVMLMVQMAGASLLLARLLQTPRAAALAFALSFPLTQLAANLAGASPISGLKVSLVLAVWLGGLLCWRLAFPTREILVTAMLSTWVFGSAIGLYLLMEFRPNRVVGEVLWDMAPLLLAGEFPGRPALPGLLMVNLVLSFAALAGRRRWIGRRDLMDDERAE